MWDMLPVIQSLAASLGCMLIDPLLTKYGGVEPALCCVRRRRLSRLVSFGYCAGRGIIISKAICQSRIEFAGLPWPSWNSYSRHSRRPLSRVQAVCGCAGWAEDTLCACRVKGAAGHPLKAGYPAVETAIEVFNNFQSRGQYSRNSWCSVFKRR